MEKGKRRNDYILEILLSVLLTALLISINYVIAQGVLGVHCNPGIAFGIVLPQAAFVFLWCGVMLLVTFLLITGWKEDSRLKRIGLWFIICGGIANMADRLIHGCVIDYISLVSWNSFNLADTAIFCGAILVIFFSRNRVSKFDMDEV